MQVQVHVMNYDGANFVRVDLAETAMQASFVLTPEDATSLAGLLSDAAVTPVTEQEEKACEDPPAGPAHPSAEVGN